MKLPEKKTNRTTTQHWRRPSVPNFYANKFLKTNNKQSLKSPTTIYSNILFYLAKLQFSKLHYTILCVISLTTQLSSYMALLHNADLSLCPSVLFVMQVQNRSQYKLHIWWTCCPVTHITHILIMSEVKATSAHQIFEMGMHRYYWQKVCIRYNDNRFYSVAVGFS